MENNMRNVNGTGAFVPELLLELKEPIFDLFLDI